MKWALKKKNEEPNSTVQKIQSGRWVKSDPEAFEKVRWDFGFKVWIRAKWREEKGYLVRWVRDHKQKPTSQNQNSVWE